MPGCNSKFQDGQGAEQHRFDQAADILAMGATGARIVAPITETKEAHEAWAKPLCDASKCAVTKIQVQEKKARECEAALKSGSRGLEANSRRPKPTRDQGQAHPQEQRPVSADPDSRSWSHNGKLRRFGRSYLCACQNTRRDWESLLQLLEGCPAFSSSSSFTAATRLFHGKWLNVRSKGYG